MFKGFEIPACAPKAGEHSFSLGCGSICMLRWCRNHYQLRWAPNGRVSRISNSHVINAHIWQLNSVGYWPSLVCVCVCVFVCVHRVWGGVWLCGGVSVLPAHASNMITAGFLLTVEWCFGLLAVRLHIMHLGLCSIAFLFCRLT